MTDGQSELLCSDLPTTPVPERGTILVTGSTGYIGGRLINELAGRGYRVRALVRSNQEDCERRWPGVEVVTGDLLKKETLAAALEGVYAAYYLVHSLHLGQKQFEAADNTAAAHFREMSEKKGLSRIIYLGGLGDITTPLSPHLKSRIEVGRELARGKTPVTTLRAAIIIGSGSASYEIMKNLVTNLPFLFLPSWTKTHCQPVAVRDVIKYLVGALETDGTTGKSYDIGGPDVLTYEEILKILAEILGKKRLFFPVPVVKSSRFYGYMASFFTAVPAPLVMSLMCGCKNEVVCLNDDIRSLIPFPTLPYREALVRALAREERDDISTRWSDSYPRAHTLAPRLGELGGKPLFTCSASLATTKTPAALFTTICRIGGNEGWFHSTFLWRLRGFLDRLMLGVGDSRGRKSPTRLEVNDVIDVWRVEELRENEMLLLRAEMKLPGQGWLRFEIQPGEEENRLLITACFHSRSLWGHLYWYCLQPFHHFIFSDMIREIDRKS